MPKSPSLSWRGETIPVSATGDEQERTGAERAGASCFSQPQLGLDPRQKGVFLTWRQEGTTYVSINCPAATGCRSLRLPACGARRQCLPRGAPHAAAPLCPRTLLGGGGELPAGKGKQEHEHSLSPLLKLRHTS